MKYVCLCTETMTTETEEFTVGDLYEVLGLDHKGLGLEINRPAAEMSPTQALVLVNKWNRNAKGEAVYYLEEDPAWL